jgi:hypothetical protein
VAITKSAVGPVVDGSSGRKQGSGIWGLKQGGGGQKQVRCQVGGPTPLAAMVGKVSHAVHRFRSVYRRYQPIYHDSVRFLNFYPNYKIQI